MPLELGSGPEVNSLGKGSSVILSSMLSACLIPNQDVSGQQEASEV